MEPFARSIDVGSVSTRYFQKGEGQQDLLLIHGGARSGLLLPSSLVWDLNFDDLSEKFRTVALDSLGQGGTRVPDEAAPSFHDGVAHLADFIRETGLRKPHLVGHDEGGLAALYLGLKSPELASSVTVIGSCAAPTGDGVPNLALTGAPHPLLSATSQSWVLERSSYSEHHVCQGSFLSEAVRLGAERLPAIQRQRAEKLGSSIGRAKSETFALLREQGIALPTLLLWGLQDPIVPLDNGLALYRLVQPRQRQAQMRVINRAGNMPFRERPEAFNGLLTSFVAAL